VDKKPLLDIIVPTHGKLNLTINCIESIYQNTSTPFHLIVDDDSEVSKQSAQKEHKAENPIDEWDTTQQYLEAFAKSHDNVTCIFRDKPHLSGNQFFNAAIKHMKTPYLATVMNSMTVEPDWETMALKIMETKKDVGVIGFKCLFPNGLIECAGITLHEGYMPIDIGRDLPGYSLSTIYEVDAIQWAFALLRKEAVEGNLDENLFHGHKGWDDIDNCYVVRSKGYKILYCGYGVGIHRPKSTRSDASLDGYRKNKENGYIFYKRWGLWNKYMESKRMEIGDRIKQESKKAMANELIQYQMLQQLLEQRKLSFVNLQERVLKDEMGVDPKKYVIGVDLGKDLWEMRINDQQPPKVDKPDAKEEEDMKVRQEAMKEPVKVEPAKVEPPDGCSKE